MAGLALDGSNPDVSLLYDINGLAKDAPHWFDRVMEFVGEYGIIIGLVLVVLRRLVERAQAAQDAPSAVAGLVWAPLAAGLALIANIPIRGFVERPRPFRDHQGLDVLVAGKTDFSFVSDHATLDHGGRRRDVHGPPEVRAGRDRARAARRASAASTWACTIRRT